MNIEQSDYGQGIGAAAGQLRSNEAESGTAQSPVFAPGKNGPWIMHEYDSLGEKHKTLKTWCKIKADAGTEYWVNKDDFDFKSKDGSNIGVVFYDRWDDFFEEIKLDKYGTYKCEKEKQKAFIKDYKLKEIGINNVQDIPSNSKAIKRFYYKSESEWSDNQKITDEYVNLSPIQKKETTEYRKDLAFITDSFCRTTGISKKNVYFQPIAFLNHLDKVATPAEFNPYEGKGSVTINANDFILQTRTQQFISNPGFAPYNTNLSANGYEYNNIKYAYITCLFDVKRKTDIHKRDTDTKKSIVKKLRTLNVTHIHELEAKAYDFLKKDKSKQIDYEYLQDRCKETEIWSKIKNDPGFNTSECKNIKCKKDLLTFVNPVYFLNHLEESGISNLHAVELLRVQERIVKMKTLQENGPGIFSVGGYTFCNHAVFLTIRAVDGNYLNFTDKYDAPIDRYYKNYDSTYPYKESSYWCVVLKKQAANTKQTGIVELYDCKKIVSLANQGYVIIVAWENIYEGKTGAPHYATVQPNQINCNKIENILLCNVGKTLKMGVSIKTAFGSKKIKELHFFYDRNQDFREDYTIKGTKSGSIQELENRDGVFK